MKIEHVLFPSVLFFKITNPFDGRSFLTKIGSLITDRVNGPICLKNPLFRQSI